MRVLSIKLSESIINQNMTPTYTIPYPGLSLLKSIIENNFFCNLKAEHMLGIKFHSSVLSKDQNTFIIRWYSPTFVKKKSLLKSSNLENNVVIQVCSNYKPTPPPPHINEELSNKYT